MPREFPNYDPAKKPDVYRKTCPSNAVLEMIADKWTALVVTSLHSGTKRPAELLSRVEGISQRMLTRTLRDLERNGFVRRTIFPEMPPHVEYELTPLGRSLHKDALNPLTKWAVANMPQVVSARAAFKEPGGSSEG